MIYRALRRGGGGDSSNVEYFSLYQKDKTKLNVTDDGTGIKANRGFIKFSANSSVGAIYINPNVPANKDCLILNDSGLYIDRKSSIDKDVAGVHYYGYDYSGLGGGFDIYVTIDDIVTYYLTDFYQFNEASNAMESLGEMRIAIRKFDPLYTGPEKEVIPVSAGTDIVVELNSEPVEIGLDELNESLTSITLPETVTRLAENGCPLEIIQELLGHSSAAITSKHYVKKTQRRVKMEFQRCMGMAA